jgi:hypothetical protein
MGTFKVFAGLLEDLFEDGDPGDVVMLAFTHPVECGLDLGGGQKDVVTVLADHLQDLDEVLEEADVVDGQVQLHVSEVTHAPLQSLPTRRTSQQLRPYSQPQVQWPVRHWFQRALVELRVGDLCL